MIATLDSRKLHQMMHIAAPGIYEAALRGDQVWLSLWADDKRVKGLDAQARTLQITESPRRLEIRAESVSWVMRRHLKSKPCVGVALQESSEPIVHLNTSGLLRPIYKRDSLTFPYVTMSIVQD